MPKRLPILFLILTLLCLTAYSGRLGKAARPLLHVGKHGAVPAPAAPVSSGRERPSLDEVVMAEDFETIAPGALPAGWLRVDGDSGYCSWFDRLSEWSAFTRAGFAAHSGSRVIMCPYNDNGLPNDDWLILPVQQLSGAIRLSYWVASQDSAYRESYEVRLSTTGAAPEAFTQLLYSEDLVPADWTYREHDLSAFAGTMFYVAFHYQAVDRFMLKLDDVELDGTPPPAGLITGRVTDGNGTALPETDVRIVSLGRQVRTDSAGVFQMPRVPVGQYSVLFEHPHYFNRVLPGTPVADGETTFVDTDLTTRGYQFFSYESGNTPRPIADFDTVTMTIYVTDTVVIRDLDVTVSLNHSYVGDLIISLQTADTEFVQLVESDPYRAGTQMQNCRFDDRALVPFTAGESPYTGYYRPLEPLSRLNGDTTVAIRGTNPRGNRWKLHVYDNGLQDTGVLYGFAMHVVGDVAQSPAAERPVPEPLRFDFAGGFPNPFNAATRFRFTLDRPAAVKLVLFDALGRQAAVVLRGNLDPGRHAVPFQADGLPSGIYFARLEAGNRFLTRKVLLLR